MRLRIGSGKKPASQPSFRMKTRALESPSRSIFPQIFAPPRHASRKKSNPSWTRLSALWVGTILNPWARCASLMKSATPETSARWARLPKFPKRRSRKRPPNPRADQQRARPPRWISWLKSPRNPKAESPRAQLDQSRQHLSVRLGPHTARPLKPLPLRQPCCVKQSVMEAPKLWRFPDPTTSPAACPAPRLPAKKAVPSSWPASFRIGSSSSPFSPLLAWA